jgi:opacity protein-like surface antigen
MTALAKKKPEMPAKWENPVYSGYFAYRTAGRLYLKGKVGLVASRFKITTIVTEQEFEDIQGEIPVLDPITMEETGETITVTIGQRPVGPGVGQELIIQENKTQVGYGLGLGVHIGKRVDLEIEYEGNQGKSQLYNFGFNAIVRLP